MEQHSAFKGIVLPAVLCAILFGQYGKLTVTINDRLLKGSERQEITSLAAEVERFIQMTSWNEDWKDLKIPLNVQFVFEGAASKGSQNTYLAQTLFSTNLDQRFFDTSVQFYYNPGGSIYYDPVQFDPLAGFLSFYAHLILAGEMDTYEVLGGTPHFEKARSIALRGVASDYSRGWSNRVKLLNDILRNSGLRKGKFSFYYGIELLEDGNPEEALIQFRDMMENFEKVYDRFPRARMEYFLKAHAEELTKTLTILNQEKMLERLAEMDTGSRHIFLKIPPDKNN